MIEYASKHQVAAVSGVRLDPDKQGAAASDSINDNSIT